MFPRKTKYGLRGSRKFQLNDLKDVLKDGRVWTAIGVVVKPEGESTHFEITTTDVFVEVQLLPDQEQVLCILACSAGVWMVPPLGSTVAVLVPTGELQADPVIVGILQTPGDGLTDTTVIVQAPAGGQVLIHDGDSGSVEPVVRKSEFEAHTHPLPNLFVNAMAGPSGPTPPATYIPVTTLPGAPPPTVVPTVPGDTDVPPAITGTSVLKAK
jgi:hypothetical protein